MNNIRNPSNVYLTKVKIPSIKLDSALKNQLLILDLNGTLVSRVKNNKSMYVRPFHQEFFNYVFDNFNVMLWSSAQPHSVQFMSQMFQDKKDRLSIIWDRTSFNLSKYDYNRKVLTIKDLDLVWSHFEGKYDATNTILLDDSPLKAQLQPFNCIHPIEFKHNGNHFLSNGDAELLHMINYLKLIQFQSNVSNYIQQNPYNNSKSIDITPSFTVQHYPFKEDKESNKPQTIDFKPKQAPAPDDILVEKMLNLVV